MPPTTKDAQVNLRLREEELARWRAAASRSGKSVSELVRAVVAKEASRLERREEARTSKR